MHLRYVRGVATKHLDTITHTGLACLDTMRRDFDVVVMCISGNSPLTVLPRLGGAKVVLNVDGSDWRRKKWSAPARAYIQLSEWLSTRLPDATVTDSRVMQQYYLERFGAHTTCITYGAEVPAPAGNETLDRLGLLSRGYFLLVGRLVPENCAHHLVDAYQQLASKLECVIVGDAPYAQQYIDDLKRRGPRVTFPGYIFGEGYRELMHHAYAVVVASEVGGTHPVLVEAMAAGNCVVVNDTPANLEVIAGAGLSYPGRLGAGALRHVLERLEQSPAIAESYRELAAKRAAAEYSWDAVCDAYEALFAGLLGKNLAPVPLAAVESAD
jgi:glycosyltransferase involved in cell wall biosynthesis